MQPVLDATEQGAAGLNPAHRIPLLWSAAIPHIGTQPKFIAHAPQVAIELTDASEHIRLAPCSFVLDYVPVASIGQHLQECANSAAASVASLPHNIEWMESLQASLAAASPANLKPIGSFGALRAETDATNRYSSLRSLVLSYMRRSEQPGTANDDYRPLIAPGPGWTIQLARQLIMELEELVAVEERFEAQVNSVLANRSE